AAFLLLVVLGFSRHRIGYLLAGGTVLGLVALTGAEDAFVGFAIAIVAGLWAGRPRRLRAVAALVVPALGLWSLWLVPMAVNYVGLGGVRGQSRPEGDLPALHILVSWGMVTPLAAWGAVVWLRCARRGPAG